ncbi:hypothetical protein PENSPDRAFT_670496 [Peniophora sp. CONT]|nr:hypothetical protein PENSPDRAFT_670496 [Peniophora sp. CONT]
MPGINSPYASVRSLRPGSRLKRFNRASGHSVSGASENARNPQHSWAYGCPKFRLGKRPDRVLPERNKKIVPNENIGQPQIGERRSTGSLPERQPPSHRCRAMQGTFVEQARVEGVINLYEGRDHGGGQEEARLPAGCKCLGSLSLTVQDMIGEVRLRDWIAATRTLVTVTIMSGWTHAGTLDVQ